MQTTTADTDFPVIERVIKRSFFSILFQLISLVGFVYILHWSPVILCSVSRWLSIVVVWLASSHSQQSAHYQQQQQHSRPARFRTNHSGHSLFLLRHSTFHSSSLSCELSCFCFHRHSPVTTTSRGLAGMSSFPWHLLILIWRQLMTCHLKWSCVRNMAMESKY